MSANDRVPPGKVMGLYMKFGEVESTRVGSVLIVSQEGYFNSLEEALADLSLYFYREYMYMAAGQDFTKLNDPTVQVSMADFCDWLRMIPGMVASAGCGEETFGLYHMSDGGPWDAWAGLSETIREIGLGSIYESLGGMEQSICMYLNPDVVANEEFEYELRELQKEPEDKDSFQHSLWSSSRAPEGFCCLGGSPLELLGPGQPDNMLPEGWTPDRAFFGDDPIDE